MPWLWDSPQQLFEGYSTGKIVGCYRDPAADERFAAGVPFPVFEDAAGDLSNGDDPDKDAFLHLSGLKFDAEFGGWERQKASDCVSHGTRNACWITATVEVDIKGEAESIPGRFATELNYAARGYRGDSGMSCSTAAKFVSDVGGVIVRGKYGEYDISQYNASLAIRWGGGIPSELLTEAKKHPIKTVSRVTTLEGVRVALQNGYGVNCCSGQGFSNSRDSEGFASARGSWSHSMAVVAYRSQKNTGREGYLIQNSWGSSWISGPKKLGQPEGSFWCEPRVLEKMVRGGGTFAFSSFHGFPAQTIPDYGFSTYV